jgi:hypothetical protein
LVWDKNVPTRFQLTFGVAVGAAAIAGGDVISRWIHGGRGVIATKGVSQMTAHGTISIWTADHSIKFQYRSSGPLAGAKSASGPSADARLEAIPPADAEADICPPGFRHFLNNPDASQQFTLDEILFDPTDQHQHDRADTLMKKLAGIMEFEPPQSVNPDIPSGYTYLLQLIAHDLVESSLFLSRSQSGVIGLNNARFKPLRLETIFGGGPIECPYAYQKNECGFRDRLRLGQVRHDSTPYTGSTGDLRDIARARATEVPDAPARPQFPEALIGDARNDSHAIVSQLVVMFHHLQRKILDNIEANQSIRPTQSEIVDAQRNFVATQSACGLIFRSIVRNDVLRKILHPDVHDAYDKGKVKVSDVPKELENGTWRVPLEFSFGFFRFGHAMIRAKYSFNAKTNGANGHNVMAILEHTSEKRPDLMPLEDIWTIDWPRFFGNADNANFSVRIGPWSHPLLEKAIRGDDQNEPGLTARDLMSSIATQPWSVRALAQALAKTHGNLLQLSPFLRGDLSDPKNPPWFGAISNWLQTRRCQWLGGCLDQKDIRTLAVDPPIPFFARFEAGLDPAIQGRHLGVLTSIVVADVFYGIFQNDHLPGVDDSQDPADQLQQLSNLAFGVSDAFAGLERITTMNGLIDFLGPLIKPPPAGRRNPS